MAGKKPFVLAVIPARGGSKRLPRKAIIPLAGKPLLCYTIEEALKSKLLDKIVVTTEDDEIASVARKYRGITVIDRPERLAQDDSPMAAVVEHAVKFTDGKDIADIIVLLQPTSPLRKAKDIDDCIEKVLDGADSAETFCEVKYYPHGMFRIEGDKATPYDEEGLKKYQRIQDAPKLYRENGAVYAVKKQVLIRENNFYGKDHRAIVMPEERSVDIDTFLDLKLAEVIINENKNR